MILPFADDPVYEHEFSVDGRTTRVTLTQERDLVISQENEDGPLRPLALWIPQGKEDEFATSILRAIGQAHARTREGKEGIR